jgi:DNA sulfur modification protein DndB
VVAALFPQWGQVAAGTAFASFVREDYIHSSALVLEALGRVGATIIATSPDPGGWDELLRPLAEADWKRTAPQWDGRAIIAGRLAKSSTNALLTAAAIRTILGLPLPPAEERLDQQLRQDRA